MNTSSYPLVIAVIVLLGVNYIWFQIWQYFVRQYPEVKTEFFPRGTFVYIPVKELYNKKFWREVGPFLWKDQYVQRRLQMIAFLLILLPITLLFVSS